MKEYVFLFPVREFFDSYLNQCRRAFEENEYDPRHLNDLIDARYRNEGYEISWLMFSLDSDPTKPDCSRTPEYVNIGKNDRIIVAGVSFLKHTKEKIEPDMDFVLGQVPTPDKLVLGGFHQDDCVDKLAKTAYQKGIPVLVDEDTTQFFFIRTALGGVIPLIRTEWSPKSLGISEDYIDYLRDKRKNKPWLIQV